jgi:aminoglycoside phosphotransferase (APT) family kinase protein
MDTARYSLISADWLRQNNVSSVQPYRTDVVMSQDGCPVTFWHDLGEHRAASPEELADILSRLHSLPVPTWMNPVSDPFTTNEAHRIAGAAWIEKEDREALLDLLHRVRFAWVECTDRSVLVPTHGDAWPGNFGTTADGVVHLFDPEGIGAGARERDLAPYANKTHSIGQYTPEGYAAFVRAYGADIRDHSDWPIYRRVHEIRDCAYALFTAQENVAARQLAKIRSDCLLGRIERPWVWPALPVDYRKNADSEAASA